MKEITKPEISWEDFEKIDMRVGTILEAEEFPGLRNPAYKLRIDFGPLGVKQSSAQITDLYSCEELKNRQIIAVVNFPKKQIKNFFSECLVMGIYGEENRVTLLTASLRSKNGSKIG